MAKLDRSRPFGESSGGGTAHRYEQDGKLFDSNGNQVGGEPDPVEIAPPESDVTTPAAPDPEPTPGGASPISETEAVPNAV